jgi:hypothetical protein
MARCKMGIGAFIAAIAINVVAGGAPVATQYLGTLGSPDVPAAFATATATHQSQLIDFDDDGFDLGPTGFSPIPQDHYASLGVTVLGLDARTVGTQPWAHSPPIGAWQTDFYNHPSALPYSFVFAQPVASFGMFANDVEQVIRVTVQLTTGTERFTIPVQGGANVGRFHGFVADSNVIQRIDFATADYHIIDDVRFGRVSSVPVPLPASAYLGALGIAALGVDRGLRRLRKSR